MIDEIDDSGLAKVKHQVLVSSGKGGVGKSTIAANLAASFAHQGLRVGLLDADITGPSQAVMWALPENQPTLPSDNPQLSRPFVQYGVKIATLATRIREAQAVQWRGPMVSMALINLLCHTDWGELDVLVVDMPPGTGDVQVSICNKLPAAGVVTVTTPQRVAVADTRRGMQMYAKQKIKLLGIVENMSTHVCENCGHENHVFGQEGASTLAKEFQTHVLGKLPLSSDVRFQSDEGAPLCLAQPAHPVSQQYLKIALEVWSQIND